MDSEIDFGYSFGVENKEAVLNWKRCEDKCKRKEENKF